MPFVRLSFDAPLQFCGNDRFCRTHPVICLLKLVHIKNEKRSGPKNLIRFRSTTKLDGAEALFLTPQSRPDQAAYNSEQ